MTAPDPVASTLKLSADGKTAAVVGEDGSITIYDVASGQGTVEVPLEEVIQLFELHERSWVAARGHCRFMSSPSSTTTPHGLHP